MEDLNYFSFKRYAMKGIGVINIVMGLFFFIIIGIDVGNRYFESGIFLMPLILFLFFTVMGTFELYYIELNEKEIIVKNLIIFWYKKSYKRDNISSIRYYSKGGQRSFREGIKISFIEKNKTSKKLSMTLYGIDFWKKMQEKLEFYKYPCFKRF